MIHNQIPAAKLLFANKEKIMVTTSKSVCSNLSVLLVTKRMGFPILCLLALCSCGQMASSNRETVGGSIQNTGDDGINLRVYAGRVSMIVSAKSLEEKRLTSAVSIYAEGDSHEDKVVTVEEEGSVILAAINLRDQEIRDKLSAITTYPSDSVVSAIKNCSLLQILDTYSRFKVAKKERLAEKFLLAIENAPEYAWVKDRLDSIRSGKMR